MSENERLNAEADYQDNRRAFIARLLKAGWSGEDAEKAWDDIQNDTEGEP